MDERKPPLASPEPNPTLYSRKNARRVLPCLLETCNLHAVLDLPGGVFTGAGVKTVVLFFNTGEATKKIWQYLRTGGTSTFPQNNLSLLK